MCCTVIHRWKWACELYEYDRIDAVQCEKVKNDKIGMLSRYLMISLCR